MENKVVRNYLYNVFYQVLVIIVPLITTPYISRTIGADGVGAYSFTNSVVSYFVLGAGLGLSMYGQREVAYHQNEKKTNSIVFFEILELKIITVSVALVIYNIMLRFINDQQYKTLLFVQEINILSVVFDVSWFFQGLEDFKKTATRNCIIKIVGVICIFLFIHQKEDLYKYAFILCISTLIGNISLWPYLKNNIIRNNIREIKPFRNIKTVVELFIPMIATTVYNVLDKTMIGTITHSNLENGYYEQTTKIVSVLLVIITSLGTVLLPRMAATYKSGDIEKFKQEVNIAYKYVILLSCPLCLGIIACSTNLVGWFLTDEFNPVSHLLKIYAFVILLIPLSNIAGAAILTPIGQQNKGTFAVLMGAICNFVINLIFIKWFKSSGAAIATIIAESVVTGIHFYYIREYIDKRNLLVYFFKHFASSFVMYISIILFSYILINFEISGVLLSLIQFFIGVVTYSILMIFVVKNEIVIGLKEKVFNRRIERGRD